MTPEKLHRRKAIAALDVIQMIANERKAAWKGRTSPSMPDVDDTIHKLSYFVGILKNYRSIRIQIEKESQSAS